MPGPSRHNRKLKARNERRATLARRTRAGEKKPASLGRTPAERKTQQNLKKYAGGPASVAARRRGWSGSSPARQPTATPARRATTSPARSLLEQPVVQNAISRLRSNRREERLGDIAAERVQPNPTMSRTDFIGRQNDARRGTELSDDGSTVELFGGRRPVGTPSTSSVARAANAGTLRRDGRRFTTPEVRRVRRQVRRARRQVRRARQQVQRSGRINIPGGEGVFINQLARRTGLNPRVVAAWTKSEGGNSFGDYNLLNIGHTGSGPNSAAANGNFADPVSAAKATESFLRGGWGGAGADIPYIIERAKGQDPATQIQVIAESGWRLGTPGPDPMYSDLITSVFNEQPGVTKANPRAKRRLERAEARAETIDEEAARLGLPGTKGLPKDGKRALEENYKIRQEKGEWAGSQALVQKILGASPDLASDKEDRGTGSYHDTGNLTSYAQDIPLSGGLEEGEPVYNQALLDRVTRRIRRMGGEVPDLKMGMGYTTGYLQGYTLEIIPDSESNWHGSGPHLHIGATWTGEKPPPGTQLGGSGAATGSVGPGGTSFPSASPNAPGGPVTREQRRKTVLRQLRELGYNVTSSGIRRTGEAASSLDDAPESVSKIKERYGVK